MANDNLARDEFILNDTSSSAKSNLDDEVASILDDSSDIIIKQYYSKQRKFSEAEIKAMESSLNEICLNDFSDEYNLTTEERFANAEEARIITAMSKTKRKCNNVVDFVIAMRYRLDAINYIAETNGVYDPDKFLKLVAKGEIILTGISIPKYTGKNRKHINWDYIFEFITDRDKDPNELREHEKDTVYESGEIDVRNLFSEAQYKNLVETEYSEDEGVEVDLFIPTPKNMKRLVNDLPNVHYAAMDYISSIKKRIRGGYVFGDLSAREEMESIQLLDNRDIRNSGVTPPTFEGNFEDRKDVDVFMREYNDWYIDNTYTNQNGATMTLREANLVAVRKLIEEGGLDPKKLRAFSKYFKTEKKLRKKAAKKNSSIKERIKDSQIRGKKRKKKGKKGKSKNTEEILNDLKKRQEEELLELSGGNYGDFSDYEDDMYTANFDRIMGNKG